VVGALLVLTGGVAMIGTDAALDMLDADRQSTSDWYCYAAPANEWECHPDAVKGRVPVYVGPESGIQSALDEAFDRDQIIEDANIGGNFNPDADLDMSQVEVRR
jgi:hypothetical protein